MGTAGLGSVLELWLLGPDVVVEPGEKLAETRAAEEEKSEVVPLRPARLTGVGESCRNAGPLPPSGRGVEGEAQREFTIQITLLKFTSIFFSPGLFEDSIAAKACHAGEPPC